VVKVSRLRGKRKLERGSYQISEIRYQEAGDQRPAIERRERGSMVSEVESLKRKRKDVNTEVTEDGTQRAQRNTRRMRER
jgi:hypothetical protein